MTICFCYIVLLSHPSTFIELGAALKIEEAQLPWQPLPPSFTDVIKTQTTHQDHQAAACLQWGLGGGGGCNDCVNHLTTLSGINVNDEQWYGSSARFCLFLYNSAGCNASVKQKVETLHVKKLTQFHFYAIWSSLSWGFFRDQSSPLKVFHCTPATGKGETLVCLTEKISLLMEKKFHECWLIRP